MPTPTISFQICLETVRQVKSFVERGYRWPVGNKKNDPSAAVEAAKMLGIPPTTIYHRLERAEQLYGLTPETVTLEPQYEVREGEIDPKSLIDRAKVQNAEYIAKKRMKPAVFMVPKEPFAVAFMGDPHLSNIGCNWVELEKDIDLLLSKQIRAVQMGDILDNFWATGKLAAKEADNHMTREEAMALAEWFIKCGLKWDAHILGNHDLWLGPTGVNMMGYWVSEAKSRLFDWNARLVYNWGDGYHHVFAAHDMKGHSQYNPLHGPGKMALWDGTADTYVAAHRHNHAESKVPNGYRNKTYQLVRVRGYKDRDGYSEGRPQFAALDDQPGRSALLVIDPLSKTQDGRQRVFMDLEEGVEFLEFIKRRHAA